MSIARLLTDWANLTESIQHYDRYSGNTIGDGVYLTGPQADFVKSVMSKVAGQLQGDRKHLKVTAQKCYDMAEEGDPIGEMYFDILNSYRDDIRKTRQIEKRVNDVIRALKNR